MSRTVTKPSVDPKEVAAAGPAVDTHGMAETTVGELARALTGAMQTPTQPVSLISRNKKEPLEAFYTRAESTGIGRRCLKCAKTRRYALVKCPNCNSTMFEDCRVDKVDPDAAKQNAAQAVKLVTDPNAYNRNSLLG